MNARVNVGKAGLVLGAMIGLWHLCWSVLVALGWAQLVIDFIFWIHFIKPVYVIEPFEFVRAVILLVVTVIVGFAVGSLSALAWNAVLPRAASKT